MTAPGTLMPNPPEPASEKRPYVQFRADEEWIERLQVAAKRKGLSVSAYIRLKVTEGMDADDAARRPSRSR